MEDTRCRSFDLLKGAMVWFVEDFICSRFLDLFQYLSFIYDVRDSVSGQGGSMLLLCRKADS